MKSEKEIIQIKEIANYHLYDISAMIKYPEIYQDVKILIPFEDKVYELQDYYCKNKDCDCTNTKFSVYLQEEEIGAIWYNYETTELVKPSDYQFLIDNIESIGKEKFDAFNKVLAARHLMIKNTFEIFKLKNKKMELDQQISSNNEIKRKQSIPKVEEIKLVHVVVAKSIKNVV